jgi:hypothetical protein
MLFYFATGLTSRKIYLGGNIMRKNFFIKTISLVLVIATVLGSIAAYACIDIYDYINKENQKIDFIVDNAVEDANNLIDKGYTSDSEPVQALCEKVAEKTENISDKAIEKAYEEGYIVECNYIEVNIGGNTVLIDPLIVIGARH